MIDIHHTPGEPFHVLVDKAGLMTLKDAFALKPNRLKLTPSPLASLTGVRVYKEETGGCPCDADHTQTN
jgi:hypothetical protein